MKRSRTPNTNQSNKRRRARGRNPAISVNSASDDNSHYESDGLSSIKIHPLLQPLAHGSELNSEDEDITPKKLKNPIRSSNWKSKSGFLLNPYIDQNDISLEPRRRKALGTITTRENISGRPRTCVRRLGQRRRKGKGRKG